MKKFFTFLKENIIGVVFFLLVISSLVASFAALSMAVTVRSQIETLSSDYHNFTVKLSSKLDSIDESIDIIKDFALQQPTFTMGDTYINHSNNSNKLKK